MGILRRGVRQASISELYSVPLPKQKVPKLPIFTLCRRGSRQTPRQSDLRPQTLRLSDRWIMLHRTPAQVVQR
jgi:hypothetical protein